MSQDQDSYAPAVADLGGDYVEPTLHHAPAAAPAAVPAPRASPIPQAGVWRRARREIRCYWPLAAAAAELLLLGAALALGNLLAARLGQPALAVLPGVALVGVAWLGLRALGLYQPHAELARHPARECVKRVLLALAVGGTAAFVLGGDEAQGALLAALVAAAVSLLAGRRLLAALLGKPVLQRRVVFLGAGSRAAKLSKQLAERDREPLARSLNVVGFVPVDSDLATDTGSGTLLAPRSLAALVREQDIDEIVVVADDRRSALPMADLVACRVAGVSVLDVDSFHEREFGKVSLERLLPSWCVFTRTFDTSALRQISKRGFDLAVLLVLVLLTWPLMLLVSAAILVESRGRGPLLYSQQRVGRHGQRFMLYKFRSMRTDAEGDGIARWAQAGDSRITAVGRVIRKLRFDELPQLWNVLKGEMSIVGPRPERPQFVAGFLERVPHYALRHCVRPGLAGWAQLRFPYGASEADAIEKLRYDLYYAKFHSLRFDLAILMETADVVLFGRGAR